MRSAPTSKPPTRRVDHYHDLPFGSKHSRLEVTDERHGCPDGLEGFAECIGVRAGFHLDGASGPGWRCRLRAMKNCLACCRDSRSLCCGSLSEGKVWVQSFEADVEFVRARLRGIQLLHVEVDESKARDLFKNINKRIGCKGVTMNIHVSAILAEAETRPLPDALNPLASAQYDP